MTGAVYSIEANHVVAHRIISAAGDAAIRKEKAGGNHTIVYLGELTPERRKAVLDVIGGEAYSFRLKRVGG